MSPDRAALPDRHHPATAAGKQRSGARRRHAGVDVRDEHHRSASWWWWTHSPDGSSAQVDGLENTPFAIAQFPPATTDASARLAITLVRRLQQSPSWTCPTPTRAPPGCARRWGAAREACRSSSPRWRSAACGPNPSVIPRRRFLRTERAGRSRRSPIATLLFIANQGSDELRAMTAVQRDLEHLLPERRPAVSCPPPCGSSPAPSCKWVPPPSGWRERRSWPRADNSPHGACPGGGAPIPPCTCRRRQPVRSFPRQERPRRGSDDAGPSRPCRSDRRGNRPCRGPP